MREEWRAVPGYEGFYEVSSLGAVRSVTRQVPYGRSGCTIYTGKNLKKTRVKNGYLTVKLALCGRLRTTYIHQIVLLAFVGPRPVVSRASRSEIRHLDGVKSNNELSNLAYGTAKENAADHKRHKMLRKFSASGKRHAR